VDLCRRRAREVSASAGTSHTRCAGVAGAGVSTFKRAAARHVLTLLPESAVVSDLHFVILLHCHISYDEAVASSVFFPPLSFM
jgi:hypothetical protein